MSQSVNPPAVEAELAERARRLAAQSPVVAAFLARDPRALAALAAPPADFTVSGWKAWLLSSILPAASGELTTEGLETILAARLATPGAHLGLASDLHAARRRALLLVIERAEGDPEELGLLLAALYDAYLDVALLAAQAELNPQYGRPVTHDGRPCCAVVVALGALGGEDISLGAPVEVLYVYETDAARIEGPHSAAKHMDVHGYFSRLYERVTALAVDPTDGLFGFVVGLGRRPEGERGSICNSVEALESYYESFGHAWERLAWLKARPAAGDRQLGLALTASLRPFIFRRHLDDGMRSEIVAMRRRHDAAAVDGAGEERFDLYRSSGGLAHIDFSVQMIQLIWGGQRPSLRVTSTLAALAAALSETLITADDAHILRGAYLAYRAAIHEAALFGVPAQVLGPTATAGASETLGGPTFDAATLAGHRAAVTRQYLASAEGLNPASAATEIEARLLVFLEPDAPPSARTAAARALGFQRPEMILRAVDSLARRPQSPFHWRARTEGSPVATLAGRVVAASLASVNPDEAFLNFEAFLRVIERRGQALLQLAADPERLRVLATLFGASQKLSGVLIRSPGLIDRLVLAGHEPILRDRAAMGAIFAAKAALHPDGWEGALAAVRRAHAAESLRIGFFDLAGRLAPREVASQLAFVAEAAIETVVAAARADISARFDTNTDGFGVVACGRLAGRELGYDSRLELIFVHACELEPAHAGRLARAVVTGLTCATPEGAPYEIGGPGGLDRAAGPLCVTRDRFLQYHRDDPGLLARASALRLRAMTPDPALGALVDEVRALAFGAFGDRPGIAAAGLFPAPEAVDAASPWRSHAIEAIVQFHQLTLGASAATAARAGHQSGSCNIFNALCGLGELGIDIIGPGSAAAEGARALSEAWVFMRSLENRLAVVQERSGVCTRLFDEARRAAGSPVSDGLRRLGRRLGLDPQRPGEPAETIEALIADYQRHGATIESATFNILRREHHGH